MVWSLRLLIVVLASLACEQTLAKTVLLEFTSPTCGPCQGMRPVMEQLKKARYDVREIDTSQEPGLGLAKQFRVESLPTFVVVVDGTERARLVGGNTSLATLVEMVHKATAIGQQKAANAAADILSVAQSATASQNPFAAAPDIALPGRVVPVGTQTSQSRSSNADRLISATVRITIDDADGKSKGTGTIVDSREGKALVLTCGHLFRSSQGKGPIEVSLFTPGPNGAELLTTAEGTLIDFDLERDLALVCFAPESPVAVAPIAPAGLQMQVGDPATSVGCAHGANPEAWATQITAIDRYQGTPNIEAAKAPVEGRSGGGLFNAAGQLVGVCNAADPERNEGLYAALPSIHAKLDALKLTFVYQTPSAGSTTAVAVAPSPTKDSPFEVRGQNPTPSTPALSAIHTPPTGVATVPVQNAAVSNAASNPSSVAPAAVGEAEALTSQDRAMLDELNRRGADAEIICIIAPREPGGRSEVIKLDRASPAFLRAIGGVLSAPTQTANAAPAGQAPQQAR